MGMESFNPPTPQESNSVEKEKLAKELQEEQEMLKYYDEQLQDLDGRYKNYAKLANDPTNPKSHDAVLSAGDCLREKNRWQEKVNASKINVERMENRLNTL